MKKRPNKIRHDDIPNQIRQILESDFWLPTIRTTTQYERLQDDHDGTFVGSLRVVFTENGDAFICVTSKDCPNPEMIRFRMPGIGGRLSRHTRVALLVLAEAIRLDNETDYH